MGKQAACTAFARLHMGIIDMGTKKRYGAIGVYIDRPRFTVMCRSAHGFSMSGISQSAEYLDYAKCVIETLCAHFDIKPDVHLEINECFPLHVGLGGRTQCALAIASAFLGLNNIRFEVEEIGDLLALGRYTSVGLHAFKSGGFIIETGKDMGVRTAVHIDFPEDWAFLVGMPEGKGLGEDEEKRFLDGVSGDDRTVMEISEKVLLEIIPSLKTRNIERFGKALSEIQELTGSYFASAQGGAFSRNSVDAIEILKKAGARGVGQSSWGPVVYGVFENAGTAQKALGEISEKSKITWFIAKARNLGAWTTT